MAYATVNPFTLETVKEFPDCTDAEVSEAIDNAHNAFAVWRATPLEERAHLNRRIAELVLERAEELGRLVTMEMGKVSSSKAKSLSSIAEAHFISSFFTFYAERAADFLAPRRIENPDGSAVIQTNEPLGIILAVEPWNYPLYQVARVLAPQLMAGNVVLLKHASMMPQTAQALEKLVRDAASETGAPRHVFTNLFATHDQITTIINDSRVVGVALTGSEQAGTKIAAQAGQALKKSTMELGGSDVFIVLNDADLEMAAAIGAANRMENGGQMCISSKRFIIQDDVYESFKDKYIAAVAEYKAGDPADEETTFGPMSSLAQAKTIGQQVSAAQAAGAEYTPIGDPVPKRGAFVQAGILEDISPDNPIHHAEIFGPVALFYRVNDDEAAVEVANDSPYGLGGSVMSSDLQRAADVAHRLETGMVQINSAGGTGPNIPFGGIKRSGYGRECANDGILEFVNRKWVTDISSIG